MSHRVVPDIFSGKRDDKNLADISKDFEQFKQNTSRNWKDGSSAPKITKSIRKPSNLKAKSSTSGKNSIGFRAGKMVAAGLVFEDCDRSRFDHDPVLEFQANTWYNLAEWMRKEAERNKEGMQSKAWFCALHDDIQNTLLECSDAIAAKYRGTGVKFSSEFGQYFLHAGGAITLLRGPEVDKGEGVEGCPCGRVHYKLV